MCYFFRDCKKKTAAAHIGAILAPEVYKLLINFNTFCVNNLSHVGRMGFTILPPTE